MEPYTNIQSIIAFTEILPDGQRCTAAIVRYADALDARSLAKESFTVAGRTVTDVYAGLKPARGHRGGGNYAVIELDPDEPAADTLTPIPGTNRARRGALTLSVRQVKPLRSCSGAILSAWDAPRESDREVNAVADEFEKLTYHDAETGIDMPYRLYTPDLAPGEQAGLILYFHGGSEMGDDNEMPLLRTQGASCWAEPEQQAKHHCFILSPQYPFPEHNWIDPDTYEAGKYLPVVYRLVQSYVKNCPIDTARLYASGMSMGAMCCWLINYRYPDMFAAMLCTVGQGDYERVGVLKDKPIWAWNAENDDKSAEGLGEIMNSFELAGARVVRETCSGAASMAELEEFARCSLAKPGHIRHTQFAEGTLGEEWAHYGWKQVYPNRVVRDWLLSHRNAAYSDREAPTAIAHVLTPQRLPFEKRVLQVSAGNRHALVLTDEGVFGWGSNVNGQLGVSPEALRATAGEAVCVYAGGDAAKVCAGNNFSAILLKNGTVLTCGDNAKGQLGRGRAGVFTGLAPVEGLDEVQDVACGTNVLLALRRDGTVWTCGDNSTGQLCDGTYLKRFAAKPALFADGSVMTGVAAIRAGMRTWFALRDDGTVWGAGNGEYGQRGDGTEGHGPAPKAPGLVLCPGGAPLTGAVSMGAARCCSFALMADGTVRGWGWNRHGDLGMGDDVYRILPEPVPALRDIRAVDCGMNHSLALGGDGGVWSWGFNHGMGEGVLGHGDERDRALPERIAALPPIAAISAGYNFSLFLATEGSLWGCGCANHDRLLSLQEN